MPYAMTAAGEPSSCREFPILVEALWSGEISEQAFIAHAARIGLSFETVQTTLNQLRAEDGVLS